MEYMNSGDPAAAAGKILCCECGVPIEPNAANACVQCVRARVDVAEGVPRQATLSRCKGCERFLQPPDAWVAAPLESRQLLAVCLRRLRAPLAKLRLTDAAFVWTEPHSKRIKLKLTVQKEVMGGAVLQQVLVVEFVVQGLMCDDCHRAEAKDFWRACVQVRQRCDHKKTLFYLEQLILKQKAHLNTTGIKPVSTGIDFFYEKQQDARKLVEFLNSTLPCKYNTSQELVTHDAKNNVFDYKHTFCVEIVPICKDNVVCLSRRLAASLGHIGRFCICYRVSNLVQLIDPATGQSAEVSSSEYWRDPFESLCQTRQLIEYTVIDCEPLDHHLAYNRPAGHGRVSTKHSISGIWVQRSSELGKSDAQQFYARSHLGRLLSPGDSVLGLHVATCNVNNKLLDQVPNDQKPDVILVKKVFDRTLRRRRRNWKLKRLADEKLETASMENDFAEFLEDLEEDAAIRQNIQIFKDEIKTESVSEYDAEGLPCIPLEEMLQDLDISDVEMSEN